MTKKIVLKSLENSEKNAEKIRQIMESTLGEHLKGMTTIHNQVADLAKTLTRTRSRIGKLM